MTIGTTAVVMMSTERTPNGIDYSVWIEYQSEDCATEREEVWHEKLSFDGRSGTSLGPASWPESRNVEQRRPTGRWWTSVSRRTSTSETIS